MSDKTNCTCNTQVYYTDRQCVNHSTVGYPDLAVDDDTIARVVEGEVVYAADINTIKNNIRSLIKLFNGNGTFVSSRGSTIPLKEATDYTVGKSITNTTFNNLSVMGSNVGGEYTGTVEDGAIIQDDEWAALITSFNTSTSNCVCNTDCSCNTVCSVVSDCGCNYS